MPWHDRLLPAPGPGAGLAHGDIQAGMYENKHLLETVKNNNTICLYYFPRLPLDSGNISPL